MRLRLLIGYLILECAVLLSFWSVARFTSRFGFFDMFLIGLAVGVVLGSFISLKGWPYLASLISQKNPMTGHDAIKLLGPRWFFPILILLGSSILYLPVNNGYQNLFLINTIIAGVLNGGGLAYFFILASRIFFEEKRIGQKIVIMIE